MSANKTEEDKRTKEPDDKLKQNSIGFNQEHRDMVLDIQRALGSHTSFAEAVRQSIIKMHKSLKLNKTN